ncbi:MAG: hypothetical protein IKP48_09265 [Bacteroidaceae bacterium]|nr:hypothetical protein [Bacteroidaceae bacterium]
MRQKFNTTKGGKTKPANERMGNLTGGTNICEKAAKSKPRDARMTIVHTTNDRSLPKPFIT